VLHSVEVLSDILGSIDPFLLSVAFLHVILELALVLGTIDVSVVSIPICHIVLELSSINIAFGMPEGALTLSFIVLPEAFVVGSISPILHTIPMSYDGRQVLRLPWPITVWKVLLRRISHLLVLLVLVLL